MSPNPPPAADDGDRTVPARTPAPPPPTTPAPPPVVPGVRLGDELARGGMGVVYRGVQEYLDRPVAVKVLASHLDSKDFVARFQREARILAGLSHPHLVACHGGGVTDQGQCFLVMEFVDGPTLRQHCERNGPLAEGDALRLVRDLAQALACAHQAGVIHRDVKPENVLLQRDERRGGSFPFVPKLVDLGLARREAADDQRTLPGTVMGTLATMAPEQFDSPDQVDFRADLYGLGCVAWFALTAKPAFRVHTLREAVLAKSVQPPPDPRAANAAVSPAAAALVQRLLAPEPAERPASYEALLEALTTLIGSTGHTTAVTLPPQKRVRGSLVAAGVLFAILGGATVWFFVSREPQLPQEQPQDPPPVQSPDPQPPPPVLEPKPSPPPDRQPPPEPDVVPHGATTELFAEDLGAGDWQQTRPDGQQSAAFALYDAGIVSAHCPAGEARAQRALPAVFALEGVLVSEPDWGKDRAAAAGIELRFAGQQPLCLWLEPDGDGCRVALGERDGDRWPPQVLEDRSGGSPKPQQLSLKATAEVQFTVRKTKQRLELTFGVEGQRRQVALAAPAGEATLALLVRDGLARFRDFRLQQ